MLWLYKELFYNYFLLLNQFSLYDDLLLQIFNLIIPDISLIQQEVDALEELSRQLFLETVDLQATKVTHFTDF